MLGVVSARGVQIYECRTRSDDATEWASLAPEAELFVDGKRIGTHDAGPQWESFDGSKVAGIVKARAEAPQAGAIPRLLLVSKSVGPEGALARVTSIQRINTQGGSAPGASECNVASVGK